MNKVKLAEGVIGVAGYILLLYGIAQWSRPGAFVTAGVLLMAIAWWPAKAEKMGR